MAKCSICNQTKGKRFCSALSSFICTACCGINREKKISCFTGCEYLEKGSTYQREREITNEINTNFNGQSKDIFNSDAGGRITKFVGPLEEFFIDQFYKDSKIDDGDIYKTLVKVYLFQTERIESLKPKDKIEKLIFDKFLALDKIAKNLSKKLKAKLILRILKSIKDSSGGIFGNRNYLEMIYSRFNEDGKWSDLFRRL